LLAGGEPGLVTYGAVVVAGALNEISHHGAQICMLRDFYRATNGRVSSPESP
jgi:hypothetical protein